MRPLTNSEKDFIDANWHIMTYAEMTDKLELNSVFKVREYCQGMNYSKRRKKELSEDHKIFVRANYKNMTESDMARKLEISKYIIQEFKKKEGLKRNLWEVDQPKVKSMFFDVCELENWVA